MTQTLALAFLKQGRADYELYAYLQTAKRPRCHWLHALQMACEKTAKAYLAAGGETIEYLKESHLVFGDYVGALRRNRAVRAFLPEKWQSGDYFWKKIRPLSDAIERLVPGRHNTGLNAEYPWKAPNGSICCPVENNFAEIISKLDTNEGRNLITLLEFSIYDRKWAAVFGIDLPSDWGTPP